MTFEQFLKEGIRDYKVLDKNGYEVPGIIDSYIPNSLLDELVDYNSETKNLKFINRISRIEREKEIDGHKEGDAMDTDEEDPEEDPVEDSEDEPEED